MKRQVSLKIMLALLIALALTVTFAISGATLLFYRLPQISNETERELRALASDMAERSERRLISLQGKLEIIQAQLLTSGNKDIQLALSRAVGPNSFIAIYQADLNGTIKRLVVDSTRQTSISADAIKTNLAKSVVFQNPLFSYGTFWSEKYRSPITQREVVSVSISSGDSIIIAEIPVEAILSILNSTAQSSGYDVAIADTFGHLLANSEQKNKIQDGELSRAELFQLARQNSPAFGEIAFHEISHDVAIAYSPLLNWYFLANTPNHIRNPKLAAELRFGLFAGVMAVILAILLLPLLARRMARPIGAITENAQRIVSGQMPDPWPVSAINEINHLSRNLDRMSTVLREQANELEFIFRVSPIGMLVADPADKNKFIKANDAVAQLLGFSREELLGHNGESLGVWENLAERKLAISTLERTGRVELEAWHRRKDGSRFLAAIQGHRQMLGNRLYVIWVIEDVTDMRRIEGEIRQLNVDLENRVEQRTNELRLAQDELVRADKLASLGAMVAGIAHELNTPVGNAMMAASTLGSTLTTFRQQLSEGLKRSQLEHLLNAVSTGTEITLRNLERAGELVTSFKQVAVDQTSSQRRTFVLQELLNEIAVTLRPTLGKQNVKLESEVTDALVLDSYPGPLGQVLTNLIVNASIHAYPNGQGGTVRICAMPTHHEAILLRVEDKGAGIPADFVSRIFDPFVTSRMGQGGTGLGLHIVHNLVVDVLGGKINVTSQYGQGTCFELRIPLHAPMRATPVSA